MPPHPEAADILARLDMCVRQGDWSAVAGLTKRLGSDTFPMTPEALRERLRRLQNALVAARIARSNLAVRSGRVRAAAGFTHTRAGYARQEFGAPADY